MASSFGKHLKITIFGESHGPSIGVVIEGLKAGLKLDQTVIRDFLDKRRSIGEYSTARKEKDEFRFMSGWYHDHTTGGPLVCMVDNVSVQSQNYQPFSDVPRPSHADYTAQVKYRGFQDPRGGGHFSGRLTVGIVIAGAIFTQLLAKKGIQIGTHIAKLKDLTDDPFVPSKLKEQITKLNQKQFATISDEMEERMKSEMLYWKEQRDSIGGVLETIVTGVEPGIGEPFFDGVESVLSQLLFAIPGVKGVEFGLGFTMAYKLGSEVNDRLIFNKTIQTQTNHSGGINGGITNGMPIRIQIAIRPPASIGKPQESLHLKTMKMETLEIKGRHDPSFIHRARIVCDSMVAIGLADLFSSVYGVEWMNL